MTGGKVRASSRSTFILSAVRHGSGTPGRRVGDAYWDPLFAGLAWPRVLATTDLVPTTRLPRLLDGRQRSPRLVFLRRDGWPPTWCADRRGIHPNRWWTPRTAPLRVRAEHAHQLGLS